MATRGDNKQHGGVESWIRRRPVMVACKTVKLLGPRRTQEDGGAAIAFVSRRGFAALPALVGCPRCAASVVRAELRV
jgi:hypothetical protein